MFWVVMDPKAEGDMSDDPPIQMFSNSVSVIDPEVERPQIFNRDFTPFYTILTSLPVSR